VRRVLLTAAAVTLAAVLLAALASSGWPDGLSRVAEDLGFAGRERTLHPGSPLAGYQARFLPWPWAGAALSGLVGAALVYGFGVLLGRTARRRQQDQGPAGSLRSGP